ncbi:ribose 5-phosphate isomerase A-domain-containing protein [Ilyonectria sp. MPI-CAGE-AT-0026]|nr:ribose 5-phosphate isomerase A-domain-containing protein [Ilyonectria sp. MPI-CAGE-AT-0026]
MAAQRAVDEQLSPHHSWVGIGSGSTVKYVVEAIAKLDRSITKRMTFVPTGDQSRLLIEGAGLRVGTLSQLPDDTLLDVSFDGADEIDDELNLIKGGGACLLQEKIVAAASKRFICVADCRKLSTRLGANWEKGIPIEVLPLAATRVLAELRRLGSVNPQIRQGGAQKAGPIVTDNGMWIIDAPFPPLALPHDPAANKPGKGGVWPVEELSNRLMSLPGVIDTGIFTGKNGNQVRGGAQKPVAVYLGMANGEVGKLGG